jgi:hypothetical protein
MKIFNIGSASSTRMANKAVKSKDLEQIDHAINTIVKKRQNLKSDLKKVEPGAQIFRLHGTSKNSSYESQKAMNRYRADFQESEALKSKESKYDALLENLVAVNSKSTVDMFGKFDIDLEVSKGEARDSVTGKNLPAGFSRSVHFNDNVTTHYFDGDKETPNSNSPSVTDGTLPSATKRSAKRSAVNWFVIPRDEKRATTPLRD